MKKIIKWFLRIIVAIIVICVIIGIVDTKQESKEINSYDRDSFEYIDISIIDMNNEYSKNKARAIDEFKNLKNGYYKVSGYYNYVCEDFCSIQPSCDFTGSDSGIHILCDYPSKFIGQFNEIRDDKRIITVWGKITSVDIGENEFLSMDMYDYEIEAIPEIDDIKFKEIDIVKFANDFNRSPIKIGEKYQNKFVKITCQVDEVGDESFTTSVNTSALLNKTEVLGFHSDSYEFRYVNDEIREQVKEINKNDIVIVYGQIRSLYEADLGLICHIDILKLEK